MTVSRTLLALALATVVVSCETFTAVIGPTHYSGQLAGANVKPAAVTTPGTGTMTASWDPRTRTIAYTVGFSGLASAATSVHLHGPATDLGVADALIDFDDPPGSDHQISLGTDGSATGRIDLSLPITPTVTGDSLVKLLQLGRLYVDVHTSGNPGGEIRAQLREN